MSGKGMRAKRVRLYRFRVKGAPELVSERVVPMWEDGDKIGELALSLTSAKWLRSALDDLIRAAEPPPPEQPVGNQCACGARYGAWGSCPRCDPQF